MNIYEVLKAVGFGNMRSGLRLSRLLFVTSPCFLLKASISSLSVCYVTAVFWASIVSSSVLLRRCTIFSRFPLFHYLFVTSVLCSRLRLSLLLFVTSLCFLLIVPLFHYLFVTVCYVSLLSLQGFHCFIICLLRHFCILGFDCLFLCFVTWLYYLCKVSIVSLSVCYVTTLFSRL